MFVDRYMHDSRHRHGGSRFLRLRGARYVCADISALPFRPGAFDHACCAHTLEHLPDPAAAAAEMLRVCRGGVYVEVPAAWVERLLPVPSHLWLCAAGPDGLRFTAKGLDFKPCPRPPLTRAFWRAHARFLPLAFLGRIIRSRGEILVSGTPAAVARPAASAGPANRRRQFASQLLFWLVRGWKKTG